MEVFDVNNLPVSIGDFHCYQRTAITRAYRIDGSFTVNTKDGPVECRDGYIVLDARRVPQAMSKEQFNKLYKPITQKKKTTSKSVSKVGE